SWTPPREALDAVKETLRRPGTLQAALGYYRQTMRPVFDDPAQLDGMLQAMGVPLPGPALHLPRAARRLRGPGACGGPGAVLRAGRARGDRAGGRSFRAPGAPGRGDACDPGLLGELTLRARPPDARAAPRRGRPRARGAERRGRGALRYLVRTVPRRAR